MISPPRASSASTSTTASGTRWIRCATSDTSKTCGRTTRRHGRHGRRTKARMRILITGPMGYVGPVLTRHLRHRFPDAELIGFDSGFFAHNLTGASKLPETLLDRMHFGDIRSFPPQLLDG